MLGGECDAGDRSDAPEGSVDGDGAHVCVEWAAPLVARADSRMGPEDFGNRHCGEPGSEDVGDEDVLVSKVERNTGSEPNVESHCGAANLVDIDEHFVRRRPR